MPRPSRRKHQRRDTLGIDTAASSLQIAPGADNPLSLFVDGKEHKPLAWQFVALDAPPQALETARDSPRLPPQADERPVSAAPPPQVSDPTVSPFPPPVVKTTSPTADQTSSPEAASVTPQPKPSKNEPHCTTTIGAGASHVQHAPGAVAPAYLAEVNVINIIGPANHYHNFPLDRTESQALNFNRSRHDDEAPLEIPSPPPQINRRTLSTLPFSATTMNSSSTEQTSNSTAPVTPSPAGNGTNSLAPQTRNPTASPMNPSTAGIANVVVVDRNPIFATIFLSSSAVDATRLFYTQNALRRRDQLQQAFPGNLAIFAVGFIILFYFEFRLLLAFCGLLWFSGWDPVTLWMAISPTRPITFAAIPKFVQDYIVFPIRIFVSGFAIVVTAFLHSSDSWISTAFAVAALPYLIIAFVLIRKDNTKLSWSLLQLFVRWLSWEGSWFDFFCIFLIVYLLGLIVLDIVETKYEEFIDYWFH